MDDDPLSTLLPKPPLPRPAAREAAIDEAMRRFDGAQETPSVGNSKLPAKRTWLAQPWARQQLGALLATAIVGMVTLPLWTSREQHAELASRGTTTIKAAPNADTAPSALSLPAAREVASTAAESEAPLASRSPSSVDEQALADKSAETVVLPSKPGAIAAASELEGTMRRAPSVAAPAMAQAEPAPAPAAPPPSAPRAIAANRAAPAAAAESRMARDDAGEDIVTTARRRDPSSGAKAAPAPRRLQARQTSRSGDWNACTVDDPARSLGSCAANASGPIAEGLSRAWRGDFDGAIVQFNQAITASPQSGLAYLNRGLAYERKGNRARALADLDRAVRQAPNSARAYYNRSLLLRRQGQKDRADADAAQAVELDPRYSAVIR